MLMVDSELSSESQSSAAQYTMRFSKMQGLGNDFVVVSEDELNVIARACGFEINNNFLSSLAEKICDRHFSVGADGFIVVRRSDRAENQYSWTYINSDGSSSLMCGNGVRCVGLWLRKTGWTTEDHFIIETGAGDVEIEFESSDKITSDLGVPILKARWIPTKTDGGLDCEKPVIAQTLKTKAGGELKITCVNMGNPHCIIYVDDLSNEEKLAAIATEIQANPFFPQGVNVEFVKVISETHLQILVWERGCGKTLACASGAAATLVASVLEKKSERNAKVQLPGGSLQIEWNESDDRVRITGPAAVVFDGRIDLRTLKLPMQKDSRGHQEDNS